MKDKFLNLIPNDILNLIYFYIKPSIKCSLNKVLFNRFYFYKFNKYNKFCYSSNKLNKINNYNYILYILKNDLTIFLDYILDNIVIINIDNEILSINLYKINFNNNKHTNIVEFVYYYANFYNSINCKYLIAKFVKKYNLSQYTKKIHKNKNNNNNNNNKNIKWKV